MLLPRRCQPLGVGLTPSTSPGTLTKLLSWSMVSAGATRLRGPLGKHVLVVVEDLHVAVHEDGSHAPCLEWIRQLVDAGSVTTRAEGARLTRCAPTPAGAFLRRCCAADSAWRRAGSARHGEPLVPWCGVRSLAVSDVLVSATSCPHRLLEGSPPDAARLWRHFSPIHVDGLLSLLPAADAAAHSLPSTAPGGQPLACVFRPLSMLTCLAHSTLLHMATGPARVPELLALGPLGIVAASRTLGLTLHKLQARVASLQRLNLVKRSSDFGVGQLSSVLQRVAFASELQTPAGACWSISDVLHRLLFEVGQQLGCSVGKQSDRDVLGRVALQAMGKEVGALLTGKFDPAVWSDLQPGGVAVARQQHPQQGAAAEAARPLSSSAKRVSLISPEEESALAQEAEDKAVAALWTDYATSADGPSMTALIVSLIGKVLPSDIDKLVAAARADALLEAGRAVQKTICGLDVPPLHGPRSTAAPGAARNGPAPEGDGVPPPAPGRAAAHSALVVPWPVWLHQLPTALSDLPALVRALAAQQGSITRESSPVDSSRRSTADSLLMPLQQHPPSIPALPLGKLSTAPSGRGAATALPALHVPDGGDDHARPGAEPEQQLDPLHAQLALDIMADWELSSGLVAAANVLAYAPRTGAHHVLVSGADGAAMLHLAQLAVLDAGHQLVTLMPPVGLGAASEATTKVSSMLACPSCTQLGLP